MHLGATVFVALHNLMGLFLINKRSKVPVLSVILFVLGLYSPLAISMDESKKVPFGVNYNRNWGGNHLTVLDNGTRVQLFLDEHSGAGFNSMKKYGSGIFRMEMKLPNKNSRGVITTFYLTSVPIGTPHPGHHDEVDIEFLGGNGKPFVLSTNVFANDSGNREQQFALWFDPTEDFHTYEILWNQYQIAFFVDKIPIRVFPNLQTKIGAHYPSQPMHVETSIWNYTAWLGPVDWSQAPFVASYRRFGIDACMHDTPGPLGCKSTEFYWNAPEYWQLSPIQRTSLYEYVRKHMIYDYCADKSKHFIECKYSTPR